MKHDSIRVFPRPPRHLSQRENRGTAVVITLGLVILVGISALIPALQEEERLAQRHARVWNDGAMVDGVVEAKSKSQIGRKEVRYRYKVEGQEYVDERVITHIDDYDSLEIGKPIALRVDPKDPEFSVTSLDVAPSSSF